MPLRKNKNGMVIEWAIVFGLLIFIFMGMIATAIHAFSVNNRTQTTFTDYRTDLDQIGEYFVRCVGTRSNFIDGQYTSTDYVYNKDMPWLDQTAHNFFKRCNSEYGFSYSSENTTHTGTFLEFYRDEGAASKLTVKKGDTVVLSIAIDENVVYDETQALIFTTSTDPETSFRVLEWTVNDCVEFENQGTGFLTKFWQWIGSIFDAVDDASEIYTITFDNEGTSTFSTVIGEKNILLPTPTRDGYLLKGWRNSDTGNVLEGGASFYVEANGLFTAVWERDLTSLTNTYEFYPNHDNLEPTSVVKKGNKIDINGDMGFKRNGYYFHGWAETSDSDSVLTSPYNIGEKDGEVIKLYAIWTTVNYTVTYNGTELGTFNINGKTISGLTAKISLPDGIVIDEWKIKTNSTGQSATISGDTLTIPQGAYGNIELDYTTTNATYTIMNSSNVKYGEYTYNATNKQEVTLDNSGASSGKFFYFTTSNANITVNNYNTLVIPAGTTGNITVTRVTGYIITVNAGSNGKVKLGAGGKEASSVTVYAKSGTTCNANNNQLDFALNNETVATVYACPVTDYTVSGWSNVPSSAITSALSITANFKKLNYVVTLSLTNATGSVSYGGTTISASGDTFKVPYGQTVTVTLGGFTQNSSKSVTYEYDGNSNKLYNAYYSSSGPWTFTMPEADVTVEFSSSESGGGGCVTGDTLITMADGSRRMAADIRTGDEILTFDHVSGKISSAPVAYVFKDNCMHSVIDLNFANGTTISIIDGHGFFCCEENRYVVINALNAEDYIGCSFYNAESGEFVKLTSASCSQRIETAYSFLSEYHINHVADGFLAVSDEIEGLYNYFEFDGNLKYDETKMQNDIEAYGLVPYEMFSDYCTREEFEVFNCKYLEISIGKGLTTAESLAERMLRFTQQSE